MSSTTIYDFLQNHKSVNNEPYTHTGLTPMMGKYFIPPEHLDTFYKLYNKSLKKDEKLALTEMHEELSPILIDIDLRFNEETGINRQYNESHLETIVRIYNEQVQQYFDINEDDIQAYVFEKETPVRFNGNIKDGIHIIYPKIISKANVQFEIRQNVIKLLQDTQCIHSIGFKNPIEDVIDKAIINKNPWLMYGSSKPDQKPYVLTHIYSKTVANLDLPNKLTLPKLLSIRNHKEETKVKLNIQYVDRPRNISSNIVLSIDGQHAIQLVNILSENRADNYDQWLELGFCLHNVDHALLETWITFSKISPKFKDGACEKLWKTFKNKGLTIASLHRWAKIDNPEKYKTLKTNAIRKKLIESLSNTNYDVACVIYEMYKHTFTCASTKHNTWYQYKNHRWNEMSKGVYLRKKISNELVEAYKDLSRYYQGMLLTGNDSEIEDAKKKNTECRKVIDNLKTTNFKDKVMIECCELFYNPEFLNKLDSNVNLLGFENGVYDLEQKMFRDGVPDDYISYSTQIDYTPFDQTSEEAIELSAFIKKVLPINEVRKYVLSLLSSFLNGKIEEQKFHIWTGSGGNGKSTLIDLFEKAFGDYCGKLPVTVLTQKRSGSSAASPEIAKTKGKRFISLQEPEQNDQIHVGYMKELTGGDLIQARALYSEPVEFKPQFKIVLACNELPSIPSNDGGTWRRLRVVDFPSKFVDNPSAPNEYKKDTDLNRKLKLWRSTFMSMLIEIYKDYCENGIIEPKIVKQFTKEYQKSSDAITEYIEEHLEQTNNKKDVLQLSVIMNHFRMWFKDMYSEKPPTRKNVKPQLEKFFNKKMESYGWRYVRFKEESNEDNEDDSL